METLNPVAKAMREHIEVTAREVRAAIAPQRHANMVTAFGHALLAGQNELAMDICKAEARMGEIVEELGDQLCELGGPREAPADSNVTIYAARFDWLQENCEALRSRDPLIREFHQLWQSRLMA